MQMNHQEKPGCQSAADMLGKGPCHAHFVGVCGVGMAGLAFLLKARGFKVTGCDLSRNRLADWLEQNGIPVLDGHDASHISADVKWVVKSSAVPDDAPEIARAKEAGVPVNSRGETLAALLAYRPSVAVCGTHGKTTTTTFIAQMLRRNGMDPSWCVGGENDALGGVAGAGGGAWMIVEADESDGTLALYRPEIAVVTNIEFDHMEHFKSVEDFEECFRAFVRNTRRKVVYCADDPRTAKLCGGLANRLAFGFSEKADVQGRDLALKESSLSVAVAHNRRLLGRIELRAPGRHNALNALAVTAVGLELGLSFEQIQTALKRATLPRRRFEKIAESDGILVISDYAHHPSEVAALVGAARKLKHSRLVAVYQPHRYTRTLALGPQFPPAFEGLDKLVLAPVYAASEKPLKGGTVWDLCSQFSEQRGKGQEERGGGEEQKTEDGSQRSSSFVPLRGTTAGRQPTTTVATSLEQAWAYFRHELRAGDVFLVIGAGDVEKIAGWARAWMIGGGRHPPSSHDAGLRRTRKSEVRSQESEIRDLKSEMVANARPSTTCNRPTFVPRCGTSAFAEAAADKTARQATDNRRRTESEEWKEQIGKLGLSAETTVRFDEPLAAKTTMKVGGAADVWIEIGSESDLSQLLRWAHERGLPFHILGGGSNAIVSDLGVRGVVARLTGEGFRATAATELELRVGAGLPLARFLDWAEKEGYAGFEFLEGIPGTIGGALRMNAGAHGSEIGQHALSARCLNMDGSAELIERSSFAFGYRRCGALENRVAVEVALQIPRRGTPEEIKKRRSEIREKRAWWKGMRCAGSVFKNPEGNFAGKLIEQAGLKGLRVGGAVVSPAHANVIATDDGALASDARCLIEKVRAEVFDRFGINRETEVVFLE